MSNRRQSNRHQSNRHHSNRSQRRANTQNNTRTISSNQSTASVPLPIPTPSAVTSQSQSVTSRLRVPSWLSWDNVFKALKYFVGTVGTIILSIVSVGWISCGKEWNEIIRTNEFVERHEFLRGYAIDFWKDSIDNIRLNESRDYIISSVGVPQSSTKHQIDEFTEYQKDIYVNHYFTLICIYKYDTLEGFLVISNKEDFNYTSYRCGVELNNNSITEASDICDGLAAYYTLISANIGSRLDNNKYYIECRTQHSDGASSYVIIGYGICDISESFEGTLDIPSNLYQYRYGENEENSNINAENLLTVFESEEVKDFRNTQRVNAVLIFNDDIELLKKSLVTPTDLGLCKDEYYNLCDNYTEHLNSAFK